MIDKETLKQRFLSDPVPIRLGNLASTLGRISSTARTSGSVKAVADLLDEAKHLIEWTAAETEAHTAAELVQIQRLIVIWQSIWEDAGDDRPHRTLLATLAKDWSEKTLDYSGLLNLNYS
ncbi:MAG: hypothetical protein ACOY90_05470 [Candidatus Zhuqueibacterota bacterium]